MKKQLLTIITTLLLLNAGVYQIARGQGSESFLNLSASASTYGTGTFEGENSVVWTYNETRKVTDANYYITSPSAGFPDSGTPYIEATITGGIQHLEYKTRSYFTSGSASDRSIRVLVNGNEVDNYTLAEMTTVFTRNIYFINVTGDFTLRFESVGNKQIIIDDISWTAYSGAVDAEPDNHLSNLKTSATGFSQINLSWSDADGINLPWGYLIQANLDGNFTTPIDGTEETTDTDLSDGNANLYVAQGVKNQEFTGLTPGTQYYFKVWSYANSGANIDYKTDGTVPTISHTLENLPGLVINEINADPAVDANGDGVLNTTDDEFVELFNNNGSILDISGWTISDAGGVNHTFPENTILLPDQFIVVFGGGTPTGDFGDAIIQVCTGTSLSLNNAGDDVTIKTSHGELVTSYTYAGEAGSDQSLTRNPDITGAFVKHGTLGAATISPGTFNDGSPSYLKPNGTTGDWNTLLTSDNTKNVRIPAGYEITVPATKAVEDVKNLVLEPGSRLTIAGGLNVADNLILQSNSVAADGTGSLINNGTLNVTGTTTVQRFLADADRYYYLSSPVLGGQIGNYAALYEYNTAGSAWSQITDNPATLTAGTGYTAKFATVNQTIEFIGDINTTSAISLTYAGNNWNLLGNPFPSGLNWNELTLNNVGATVYVRTSSTVDISRPAESYNGMVGTDNNGDGTYFNGYLAPMQAFWVLANGATPDITIPNAAKTHNSQMFYKSGLDDEFILRLKLHYDDVSDETIITFTNSGNYGTDDYDSRKFFVNDGNLPQLYSSNEYEKLVINNLPAEARINTDIHLGFEVKVMGSYKIGSQNLESFAPGTDVILVDKADNVRHDLRESDYEFETSILNSEDRFVVELRKKTTTEIAGFSNQFSVFAYNKTIAIDAKSGTNPYSVEIFDITGRKLVEHSVQTSNFRQQLNEAAGYYIVKVKSDKKVLTKKLFIQ